MPGHDPDSLPLKRLESALLPEMDPKADDAEEAVIHDCTLKTDIPVASQPPHLAAEATPDLK